MKIEEAVEAMKHPGGNDANYSLRAAASVLLDDDYLSRQTAKERLRLLEAAVGLLCYRAANPMCGR